MIAVARSTQIPGRFIRSFECGSIIVGATGLRGVLVGTADKFQGREAPVVFFSLAASSAEDAPRGISFLLNRNRVNVAISRAKYAAYIVRSPRLTDYLPASPASLVELGAFLALTQSWGRPLATDPRRFADRSI